MINRLRNDWDSARRAETTRRGLSSQTDWQDRAKQAVAWAGDFVAAHPIASLGAAVVLGLAVGWWVKRK
jgi:ElaB/YqjD/DUF883 family membrane-anchored ribosome-binding protein